MDRSRRHGHGRPGGLPSPRTLRPERRPGRVPQPSHRSLRSRSRSFVAERWLDSGLDPAKDRGRPQRDRSHRVPARRARRARGREAGARHPRRGLRRRLCRSHRPREGSRRALAAPGRLLGIPPEQARLLVVGSAVVDHAPGAYRAELDQLAGPGVRFVPMLQEVATPLHAADVVVMPSVVDETFGRTAVEALATGRPVLASRVGGVPEILDGPWARFLVEPGDAGRPRRGAALGHALAGRGTRAGRGLHGVRARAIHPRLDGGPPRGDVPPRSAEARARGRAGPHRPCRSARAATAPAASPVTVATATTPTRAAAPPAARAAPARSPPRVRPTTLAARARGSHATRDVPTRRDSAGPTDVAGRSCA